MAEVQLIFMSGGKVNLPSGFGAQRTRDNLTNEKLARERPEVFEIY